MHEIWQIFHFSFFIFTWEKQAGKKVLLYKLRWVYFWHINSNITFPYFNNCGASILLALHGDLNNLSLCRSSDSHHGWCCQFVVESVCAEERQIEVCMCPREFMCFRFKVYEWISSYERLIPRRIRWWTSVFVVLHYQTCSFFIIIIYSYSKTAFLNTWYKLKHYFVGQ